jgi:hypothetical protein
MCLLIVKKKGGPLPPKWALQNGYLSNPHGCGIAHWKKGGKSVHIKKDFPDVHFLGVWLSENVKRADVCLIHFRFASSGLIAASHRHPFPVTAKQSSLCALNTRCQAALAHNGIMSEFETKIGGNSDTMNFITEVMAPLRGVLNHKGVQKLLSRYLVHQRVALLMSNGALHLYGQGWIEDEGVMYSNHGYFYAPRMTHRSFLSDWNTLGKCEVCSVDSFLEPITIKPLGTVKVCEDCESYLLSSLRTGVPTEEIRQDILWVRNLSNSRAELPKQAETGE